MAITVPEIVRTPAICINEKVTVEGSTCSAAEAAGSSCCWCCLRSCTPPAAKGHFNHARRTQCLARGRAAVCWANHHFEFIHPKQEKPPLLSDPVCCELRHCTRSIKADPCCSSRSYRVFCRIWSLVKSLEYLNKNSWTAAMEGKGQPSQRQMWFKDQPTEIPSGQCNQAIISC